MEPPGTQRVYRQSLAVDRRAKTNYAFTSSALVALHTTIPALGLRLADKLLNLKLTTLVRRQQG